MKLEAYLNHNKIPVATFAEQIGVARQTVYSYFKGKVKKIPSPEVMEKITEVTNHSVTPNDFYNLPTTTKPKR
jgi:transcriptional regulator with XRE-family HTH domain